MIRVAPEPVNKNIGRYEQKIGQCFSYDLGSRGRPWPSSARSAILGNEISKRQTDETGRRATLLSSGRSGTHFSHSGSAARSRLHDQGRPKIIKATWTERVDRPGAGGRRDFRGRVPGTERFGNTIRFGGGFVLARSVRGGRRHKKSSSGPGTNQGIAVGRIVSLHVCGWGYIVPLLCGCGRILYQETMDGA